jgi:fibronectin-binding autotransporter adhesin
MNILSRVRSVCVGTLAALAIVALSGRTSTAATFNWQGNTTTGNWDTVGATGWDAGPPDAAGDIVQRITGMTGDVLITESTSNDTVGAILIGNGTDLGNFYFEIDFAATRVLNLNNSGAGATIEYNNTNTGNAGQLWFGGGGSMNLQDNLQINVVPNLTGITAAGGSVAIVVPITGTGNITVNSNQAIPNYGMLTTGQVQPAVSFQSANTYVGTTTIEKGAVQYTTSTAFGNAANTIQLGVAGSDSATLGSSTGATTLANPITVGPSIGSNTGTLTIARPGSGGSGVTTYSGTVTLNSNVNIVSNTTGENQVFTGVISGSGGVIFPSGTLNNGRTSFRGTNTYAGDTVINGQTLVVRFGSAIPNGPGTGNVIMGGGTLELRASETINGLSGSGTITSGAASTLTLGDNDAGGTFSGSILPGTGTAIAKIGSGTQTLSGTNTYAGTTAVNAGTLLINGTNSGAGAFTVASGATLGGSGTIGSTVNLSGGGTLAPGASPGMLTVGALAVDTGANFAFELDPSNMAPGDNINDNDLIAVTGALTLTLSGVVNLNVQDSVTPGNFGGIGTWTLETFGSGTLNGNPFSPGNTDITSLVNVTGLAGNITSYSVFANVNGGGDGNITLTTVPEPSAIVLIFMGLACAGCIVRRNQK